MGRHRNNRGTGLTAKNVTRALIESINNKELSLIDWKYIKETIDNKYNIKVEQEPLVGNRFIKWLFNY